MAGVGRKRLSEPPTRGRQAPSRTGGRLAWISHRLIEYCHGISSQERPRVTAAEGLGQSAAVGVGVVAALPHGLGVGDRPLRPRSVPHDSTSKIFADPTGTYSLRPSLPDTCTALSARYACRGRLTRLRRTAAEMHATRASARHLLLLCQDIRRGCVARVPVVQAGRHPLKLERRPLECSEHGHSQGGSWTGSADCQELVVSEQPI